MAAKRKKEIDLTDPKLTNPITGEQPNTYSASVNRTLAGASGARAEKLDSYQERTRKRARARADLYEQSRTGRIIPNVPGYGQVDLDAPGWRTRGVTDGLPGYRLGGPSVPDTVAAGPAINEPHETDPNMAYMRRAEDLTSVEYKKGMDVLASYGVTPERIATNIRDSYERADMHAALALESTPAGSGFYGGDTKPEALVQKLTRTIIDHPNFKGDPSTARGIAVMATADTSPNALVERKTKDGNIIHPNYEGALAATVHALDGGDPEQAPMSDAGGVFHTNIKKAAKRVALANEGAAVGDLLDPTSSPKTSAFAGAQYDESSPDSFRVNDVHSTHTVTPHLPVADSRKFHIVGPDGEFVMKGGTKVAHEFEAEDVGHDGLPQPRIGASRLKEHGLSGYRYTVALDPKGKEMKGNTPAETMLSKGGYAAHAILDRGGRVASYDLGFTPSPDHAQAQHQVQEVDWREQQVKRPDLPYTLDTEHPEWRQRGGYSDPESDGEKAFNVFDSSTWNPDRIARG